MTIHNGPYYGFEGEELHFDGMASYDEGGIHRYEWNFGDGSKAEGPAVKHIFNNDGRYTITLKVTDNSGNWRSETTFAEIKNVAPLLDEPDLSIQETCVNLDGSFSDKGISDKHSAMIDWGDGTVTLGKIAEENGIGTILGNHAYQEDGKYNVEIKLYDNNSYDSKILPVQVTKQFDYSVELESKELVIERGSAGIIEVSIMIQSCSSEEVELHYEELPQGLSAEFTSSKDATSFASMMVISTAPNSMLGEEMITVTASGGGIIKTESFLLKIVEPQAPQNNLRDLVLPVLISSNEESGEAPLDVTFQAIAAGGEPPYTWAIDFGDGSEQILDSEGIKIETSHVYANGGEYEVFFEVRDSNGSIGKNGSLKITVDNPVTNEIELGLIDRIKVFTTSIIEEIKFDPEPGTITMLASGPGGTSGSTSLTIPKMILNPPFTVNVDGEPTDFDLLEEQDDYILSFSYPHSTKLVNVTGIPTPDNSQLRSDIEDIITVVQISKPAALGSGKISTVEGDSLISSNLSVMGAPASWILMVVGASAVGTIYATIARRKRQTRMLIEPTSAILETGLKITINIIPRSITLSAGESVTFYAKAYDEENNEVYDIDFNWSTTVKDAQLIPEGRSAKFIAPGDTDTRDTRLFGVRKGEVVVSHGNVAASANVEVRES
jgi:PKD repeat protein